MSTLVTKNLQIGADGTASNNFTVYQPVSPDGTLRIGNGNSGTTSAQVVLTSAGNVGIGTSSPSTLLELAADNTTPSNTLRFTDTDTSTAANQQVGKIEFYSSDVSTPGGSVKAYIGAFAQDTTPDVYLSFATDTTTGTPTERMRITNVGDLQFNSGYGSVATAYGCRAWVNFNGTGTVAIRASGNVSSISDNGTGEYTVNLTTAMPDANYAAVASGTEVQARVSNAAAATTTSFRISCLNLSNAGVDAATVSAAIFR